VDVCLYTLMKWAGLAAKGNPSALHFLFGPARVHDGYVGAGSVSARTLPCKEPREAVSRIRRRPDEAIARSKRTEERSPC
jgi:hypothetical protein